MAHIKNEERRDALELTKENEDIFVQESNLARKSEFVPDEFFAGPPLPQEPVIETHTVSYNFARLFNSYMHDIGKDPAYVMCRKCKEWVQTNYKCCGV